MYMLVKCPKNPKNPQNSVRSNLDKIAAFEAVEAHLLAVLSDTNYPIQNYIITTDILLRINQLIRSLKVAQKYSNP